MPLAPSLLFLGGRLELYPIPHLLPLYFPFLPLSPWRGESEPATGTARQSRRHRGGEPERHREWSGGIMGVTTGVQKVERRRAR